ncbi:MAG: dTDP-4-dehydrorhamnose reductase [Richelia sp.]|nr:dTDP-4-dehydrorhamnose reductase [Richelia sp.]
MTNILLIGSNGQVGQELQRILPVCGNVSAVARPEVDLAQPDSLISVVQEYQAQVIINAAAYTAVDQAESEPELALAINGKAPEVLASIAREMGAFLIHISTDYVFDGNSGSPYQVHASTNPLSVYGHTKLVGEQAIRNAEVNHIILRTAWVYGTYGKGNFVKTMLRLAAEREEIRVVADQIGSPTWAKDIAGALAQIIPQIHPDISGTYHYTNSGVASWYDFAISIFAEAQQIGFPLRVKRVVPITTSDYPTPAHRPGYSVLNCNGITPILGDYPPYWRQSLQKMLIELYTQTNL